MHERLDSEVRSSSAAITLAAAPQAGLPAQTAAQNGSQAPAAKIRAGAGSGLIGRKGFEHAARRLFDEGHERSGADQCCGARRQDRRVCARTQAKRFYRLRKRQAPGDFHLRLPERGDGGAAQRSHRERTGRQHDRRWKQSRGCNEAGGAAQSSPDCHVLRSDFDAARGPGAQRGRGAGFSEEEDAARRSGGAGFAGRYAESGSGFYRR